MQKHYLICMVISSMAFGAARDTEPNVADVRPEVATAVTIKDAYTELCKDFDEPRVLHLQRRGIGSLEKAHEVPDAKDVAVLFLKRNLFVHINLKDLLCFENLEVLDLSGNELESIDLSQLSKLSKLQKLKLRKNRLKKIDLSPLRDCPKLFELDLLENLLSTCDVCCLPPECIVDLTGNPLNAAMIEHLHNADRGKCVKFFSAEIWKRAKQQVGNMKELHTMFASPGEIISAEKASIAVELIRNTERFEENSLKKLKVDNIASLIERGEHGETGIILLMRFVSARCIEHIAQAYCEKVLITDEELQKAEKWVHVKLVSGPRITIRGKPALVQKLNAILELARAACSKQQSLQEVQNNTA